MWTLRSAGMERKTCIGTDVAGENHAWRPPRKGVGVLWIKDIYYDYDAFDWVE